MAITINSIDALQDYLIGVLNRAEHHAGSVQGVALTLLGAVIWRSNGEISVREYNGNPANMIWFHVNEERYAMLYNHETQHIELKQRSSRDGNVIATFDNSSTYPEIIQIFSRLG